MIEEYIDCATTCAKTDYGDKTSVAAHNRAVNRMYKIVDTAVAEGSESITTLTALLDHDIAAPWIAHQLVERANPGTTIIAKCFAIVEDLASGDGATAMGEQFWIDEWSHKKTECT